MALDPAALRAYTYFVNDDYSSNAGVLMVDLVAGTASTIALQLMTNQPSAIAWDARKRVLVMAENSPDGSSHYALFDVPVDAANFTRQANLILSFTPEVSSQR